MKLIHSGKVLKDDDQISAAGIKPNDFLVVMVTKPKKAAAPAAALTPAPAAPKEEVKTPAPAATASASPAVPPAPARDDSAAVESLTAMGFPEAEVRHCLRAAHGNPDIAVEFLTNGIPEGVSQVASAMDTSAAASPSASASLQPLAALRSHPQFNDLRRLVQSNPAMLQQVLTQIGQQQPELLQEINANQALFLEMMNEPVSESSSSPAAASSSSGMGSAMAGAGAGVGNPSQMAAMIQSMSEEELEQMSAMMGVSPDQLRQTAAMIGSMPEEQLREFMRATMEGGMPGNVAQMFGGGGGGGQQVVRLTEEEMAAVDRLTEMGFDRAEAAQAFLACDKNEALAANLLMDSMADGGGGFFGGGDDNDDDQGNNDNDDDDMYD